METYNKNNKTNPIICNNCGVIIDHINNLHFIYQDVYGYWDVCERCYEYLKEYDNYMASLRLNTTRINTVNNEQSKRKNMDKSDSLPLDENIKKPKFNLGFIIGTSDASTLNPKGIFNGNLTNITDTITDTILDTILKNNNVEKTNESKQYNFSCNDMEDSKEDKNDKNDKNKRKCCNKNTNYEDDSSSLLFFQQIMNRLTNIDNIIDNNSDNSDNSDNSNKDESNNEDNLKNTMDKANESLEYEWLGENIKTIDDLIELGKTYNPKKRKRYNLNLKQLNRLVEPLTELQGMVGMTDVKKIIFDQLIYYLQNLDDKNIDMLHTVITGPPGVGKTQLTHIIAKIYNRLGFLKTDKVICAKRDDLIGEYVGHTAPRTRKLLERALGGVLLLDEIYSLAPTTEKDFSREAIDMINMYLSEHAHDLVCVIAGYKKPTYEQFFAQNEGLARRFTHHFEIKGYDAMELSMIFKKYLEGQKWELSATLEEVASIIKRDMTLFPNFGGDMMTLFACCKKAHSRRLLIIPTEAELNATKKKIQKKDILDALDIYKSIKEKNSSSQEEDKAKYIHMYS